MKEKILQQAKKLKKFRTSDIVKNMSVKVSRQYISSILSQLVHEKKLVQYKKGKYTSYTIPKDVNPPTFHLCLLNKNIQEDLVWETVKRKNDFLKDLPENIQNILSYAFTEMLNNAIEHSRSKYIKIFLLKKRNTLTFIIRDFGVGVFRNIMSKKKLSSALEAIQDLLKGKTTTARHAHSGEGIFFTSKAGNIFTLESYNYALIIDQTIDDVFIKELKPMVRGTKITFTIRKDNKLLLENVFKKHQSDRSGFAFDKTEIKIRLYALQTMYITRSQAKRVLAGLEKFKIIVLDFDKVATIGQGFADEIFRVFQSQHPNIKIKPVHMNKAVNFMIQRAVTTER